MTPTAAPSAPHAPLPFNPAGRNAALIILVLALLAGVAGVFTMPPLDRDESRYAQASAQMLETGNFIEIRFQDAPRHKKPAGIHWLQAASVAVFSSEEARQIWAYRIPSLFGAMLAALAAWMAGLRLIDPRAAFIGAACFAVCILLGVEAAIAKTDAVLVAFTTLSMLALAHLKFRGGGRRAAIGFWAAFAAGIMIKGPVTPLVVIPALLALFLWERKAAWAKPLAWWPGPLLAVAIALPWYVAIEMATGFEFIKQAVGEDLQPKVIGGVESHGAPPGYHTAFAILQLWPATLFLIPGFIPAWRALRARRDDADWAGVRFLLAWAIPAFLIYELTPTKLSHYTMPVYPAFALLAGLGALELWKRAAPLWSRIASNILFGFAGLTGAALMVYLAMTYGDGATQLTAWIAGGVVAALTAAAIATPMRWTRILLALLAALSWHWSARAIVAPNLDPLFTARDFTGVFEPDERPIGSYAFTEPSLVFLLDGGIAIEPRERVFQRAAGGELNAFIIPREDWQALRGALADRASCAHIIKETDGLNYSNGDELNLLAVRVNCEEATP